LQTALWLPLAQYSIEFNRMYFTIAYTVFGSSKQYKGQTSGIKDVYLDNKFEGITIESEPVEYGFGYGLSQRDRAWLVEQIQDGLEQS
jgi:hypothetical protein